MSSSETPLESGAGRGWPTVLVLVIGLSLFLFLQAQAIRRQSLTGDGAHHLLAASQSVHYGQNSINWEHPPLAKLVFGLALLSEPPLSDQILPGEVLGRIDSMSENSGLLRRITSRARWWHLLLVVCPLLVACFYLGKLYGGCFCGVVLLLLMALSYQQVGQLAILQTDAAVSLGFVLTVLAATGLAKNPSYSRALLLGLALGLALSAKFSAILLLPPVLLTVVWNWTGSRTRRPYRLVLVLAGSLAVLQAVYSTANWNYQPEKGEQTLVSYTAGRAMQTDRTLTRLEKPLLLFQRIAPAPAQWLTGLLGVAAQNYLGVYWTYALGDVSNEGRIWFFPLLLLVKLPLAILVTATLVLRDLYRKTPPAREIRNPRFWIPLLVAGCYLAPALLSNYNIGFRHLMPILPLLYLPLAIFLSKRPWAAFLVLTVLALEALILTPIWISATNTWWLGNRNPTRHWFSLGVLESEQNFVALHEELQRRGIPTAQLLFQGSSPHLIAAFLPEAELISAGERLKPGWCAVSVIIEQFVPVLGGKGDLTPLEQLATRWKRSLEALQSAEDHGYLAGSFHLFRIPPEVSPGGRSGGEP